MALPGHAPAEPFFLEAGTGSRFCLFHRPAGECRGALVWVHPFAEEMNRSRRMAALASRALAAQGIGVLQLDLHGCGDSSGEFADARWDGWKADIALASGWLRAHLGVGVGLLGLRLGALLALDYTRTAVQPVERLLLWQPVTNGAAYLTQLLRLRLAAGLLQDDGAKTSTDSLRSALHAGSTLEIAGYELAPQLAVAIDGVDAEVLAPHSCPVHWFEIVAAAGRQLTPAASRIVSNWREQGANVHVELVCGQQFWTTPEVTECLPLVQATVDSCREAAHA
jgi:exosortase A-associated hydrolase 2